MFSVSFLIAATLSLCEIVRGGRFSDTLQFTGDVEKDFTLNGVARKGVIKVNDATTSGGSVDQPDVGLPPGPEWAGRRSGWDIKNLFLQLDFDTGALHIGINCFGVCGDADGDGDPNSSSMVLVDAGGSDNPDFALSESFAIGIDLGGSGNVLKGDTKMDFVLGYPSSKPSESDRFPCGDRFGNECFGVYFFQSGGMDQPGSRFVYKTDAYNGFAAGLLAKLNPRAVDRNSKPSSANPDLEWSINDFNGFRTDAGFDTVDLNAVIPWEFNLVMFAGSFQDDGIGEDFLPNNAQFQVVKFPCQATDVCGICGGDGTSCLDCRRVPQGTARYDVCDICGGDGTSCRDCLGVIAGTARYDACNVCNSNGLSCLDCKGVLNGQTVYDICDVCGGDGTSCIKVPPERDPCDPRDRAVNGECAIYAGDLFELPDIQATVVIGERGTVIVEKGDKATFQRWLVDSPREGVIAIQDIGVTVHSQFNCKASDGATYAYEHSKHCHELRLVAIQDTCESRRIALHGRILHRRPCAKFYKQGSDDHCTLRPNALYFARYGFHEWTSLIVGKRAFFQSVSGEDLHFYGTYNTTHSSINFSDLGSTPSGRSCAGGDQGGSYQLKFEDKWCSIAHSVATHETCGARSVRFGDIRLEHVNVCGNGVASACVACNDSDDDDDSWSSSSSSSSHSSSSSSSSSHSSSSSSSSDRSLYSVRSKKLCLSLSTELSAIAGDSHRSSSSSSSSSWSFSKSDWSTQRSSSSSSSSSSD